MPTIVFNGPQIDKEKKKLLIEEFTKKSSEILGISKEAFTVIIKENHPDNVGVGGRVLSEIMEEKNN